MMYSIIERRRKPPFVCLGKASVADNQLFGVFRPAVVDAVSHWDGFEGEVFEQVADWLDVVQGQDKPPFNAC